MLLAGCLALLCTVQAVGAETDAYPKVLHGDSQDVRWSGNALVAHSRQPLLQLQLSPGLVVSMGQGTVMRFEASNPGEGRYALAIDHGAVIVALAGTSRAYTLGEGFYPVSLDGNATQTLDLPAGAVQARADPALRQGFLLGDFVLTQQDKYLDSLRINVSVINSVIVSVITSIFGRR